MNEDFISDLQKRFHENGNRVDDPVLKLLFNKIFLSKFTRMNLLLSITIIVSIVQQNLLCKIYRKMALLLNEFAFKFK